MSYRLVSVAVLGLLFCPGESWGQEGKDRLIAAEYYPIEVGTIWEYKENNKYTKKLTVARHEKYHGVLCAVIEEKRNDKPWSTSFLSVRKGGVYLQGTIFGKKELEIKPPALQLKLPYQKGQRWRIGSEEHLYLGEEAVNVPAGKYKAICVVSRDPKAPGLLSAVIIKRWYAKGIGLVKEEYKDPRGTSTRVLVNFKGGK